MKVKKMKELVQLIDNRIEKAVGFLIGDAQKDKMWRLEQDVEWLNFLVRVQSERIAALNERLPPDTNDENYQQLMNLEQRVAELSTSSNRNEQRINTSTLHTTNPMTGDPISAYGLQKRIQGLEEDARIQRAHNQEISNSIQNLRDEMDSRSVDQDEKGWLFER